MNIPTTLPDYLTDAQRQSIRDLFTEVEILPISCLLYEADEQRVIGGNRQIPDDFIYAPKRSRLVCTVEGETREIGPGEFMMVTADAIHGVTLADGFDSYEVFALHMHAIDGRGHRFFERLNSPFGVLANYEQWFEKFAACTHLMGRLDDVAVTYFQHTLTWLLYEQLLGGNPLQQLPQKMDDRISRLLGRVRLDCAQEWTVTSMAKICHLSISRFRELFGQNTSTSPKKYIQKTRLSHARSLLATDPSLSVEEVANRVGISDAHYFHAIYRKQFGETPKKRGATDGDLG
jgi:AraC-like DNA-binding protein